MPPFHLIERRLEIDAAHRATFDGTKCSNLHGHRYAVLVSCVGPLIQEGPQMGMVMDFGLLKRILVEEIDAPCDHATLLWVDDPIAAHLIGDTARLKNEIKPTVVAQGYCRTHSPITGALYLIPAIPTAESLAQHWYNRIKPRIEALGLPDLRLYQVKVFESPQCMAAYPAFPEGLC